MILGAFDPRTAERAVVPQVASIRGPTGQKSPIAVRKALSNRIPVDPGQGHLPQAGDAIDAFLESAIEFVDAIFTRPPMRYGLVNR